MTIPAPFADAFASYRRMLAGLRDDDAKIRIIADCAYQTGKLWLPAGLPRPDAVDELFDMALGCGLADMGFIGPALARGESERQHEPAAARGNGQKPAAGRARKIALVRKEGFMNGFLAPDYLIDGILQRRFIYSLTGQTSHAKTAVALLLAQLVACRDPNAALGRHRVEHGRVLYCVGENPDDVRMRLMGTDHLRGAEAAHDDLWFVEGVFDIDAMVPVIAADAKANGDIALVIVDTSAAYFLGDDEISNTQMGGYARVLRKLTTLPGGPTVLVLCHPIKHATEPAQLLPRGGGAFLAEMDGNLTLWREDDLAMLDHCGKLRGPGFQPMTFRLERIEHTPGLVDTKGRHIPTVQAVAISISQEEDASDSSRRKEDEVLAAILKGPEGSLAKWATALGWVNARGEPDRKTVENAMNRLRLNKPALVRVNRGCFELTEEGKTAARKAAFKLEAQRVAAAQGSLI